MDPFFFEILHHDRQREVQAEIRRLQLYDPETEIASKGKGLFRFAIDRVITLVAQARGLGQARQDSLARDDAVELNPCREGLHADSRH